MGLASRDSWRCPARQAACRGPAPGALLGWDDAGRESMLGRVGTDDSAEAEVEGAWVRELERRAQAVADGAAVLVPWDEARERITARRRARRRERVVSRIIV